jgi:predicted GNAT family acetyltransferase
MVPKKVAGKEISAVLEYIGNEREMNLFIEGDIEQYGLDGTTVELFAFGDPWDCLLLRYFQNYCIYSRNQRYDVRRVAAFLAEQKVQVLGGKESLVRRIVPYLPAHRTKGTYLCRCNAADARLLPADGKEAKVLTESDAGQLAGLYRTIEEFGPQYTDHPEDKIEELTESIKASRLALGLFDGPLLVSAAYATARSSSGAMVVGVATRKEYRNRGYASFLVGTLCKRSFDAGLSFLCLFYDNPDAGRIYRRIGFREVGRWAMVKFG